MTPDNAAEAGAPAADTGRWVLDLSSTYWQFEGIRPGQGVKEGFHLHLGEHCSSTFNWNGAEVPGDVYTDLWRAGEIDDPHFGRNTLRAKWAMEREWWYRCKFKPELIRKSSREARGTRTKAIEYLQAILVVLGLPIMRIMFGR